MTANEKRLIRVIRMLFDAYLNLGGPTRFGSYPTIRTINTLKRVTKKEWLIVNTADPDGINVISKLKSIKP